MRDAQGKACCRRAVGTGGQVPTPPPDFCRLPCPQRSALALGHRSTQRKSQHQRPPAGQGAEKRRPVPRHTSPTPTPMRVALASKIQLFLAGQARPLASPHARLSQTQQIHKRLAAHPGCRIV
ncbi:hypothetical protein FA09DRAFT_146450 [Tilletiopsis washingtonensis]|uniref:Uncharacterized protein n=1 Tax=Tilletiopsis washingtonensis TaxID=58919 RepID=A0A316Z1S0_9BASI|nr:hypothetical protein FA09DRAFT_146450 [Tilletiopsis washingtonensis]PWN95306.1 hypothetical protein FA09DRAFT_146450 [Tilletiopsis washingtonensis]